MSGGAGAATVASLVKSAIKSAVHLDLGPSPVDLKRIKNAFDSELARQFRETQIKPFATWSETHDAFAQLTTQELTDVHERAVTAMTDHSKLVDGVTTQMLVAWTNFLARAKRGAVKKSWDYWSPDGGIAGVKLEGAENPIQQDPSSRTDPMASNVDPSKMQWALDGAQRPMQSEHFGILEILLSRC